MTTDLIARIAQLQQELDEAQRIANNNFALYAQAKEQRDELLGTVKMMKAAFRDNRGLAMDEFKRMQAAIAKAEGR